MAKSSNRKWMEWACTYFKYNLQVLSGRSSRIQLLLYAIVTNERKRRRRSKKRKTKKKTIDVLNEMWINWQITQRQCMQTILFEYANSSENFESVASLILYTYHIILICIPFVCAFFGICVFLRVHRTNAYSSLK